MCVTLHVPASDFFFVSNCRRLNQKPHFMMETVKITKWLQASSNQCLNLNMTQVSDDKMKMKSNGKRPFSPGNSPRWSNRIHPKNNIPVPDTTGVWWPTLGMDTRYILVNWREVRQEIFRLDLQNRSGLSILYCHKHSNLTTRQASWKWKGGNCLCGVLESPSSKRL